MMRDRSIGLIQIRHAMYSHEVAWVLRPFSVGADA